MSRGLAVAMMAPDPGVGAALGLQLARAGLHLAGTARSVAELRSLLPLKDPQVVLLAGTGEEAMAALRVLAAGYPGVGRVVALPRRDFAACRAALRAGADEVVVLPGEEGSLSGALGAAAAAGRSRRARRALGPGAADPGDTAPAEQEAGTSLAEGAAGGYPPEAGPGGYVVGFWSGRGGAGKTTLAAGTALALAGRGSGRVLLIDLDLALGGADVALDLRPERTILDLVPVLGELDRSHLERVAVRHPAGLWVLCGGAGLGTVAPRGEAARGDGTGAAPGAGADNAAPMGAEAIRLLLRACRRHFDTVILDIPSALTPATRAALSETDAVFYVVTPDLPAIRTLVRVLESAGGAVPVDRERLALVINRAGRLAALTRQEIEGLARLPVVGEVRSDFRTLQAHLVQGLPLVRPGYRRLSPLGREIARLAAAIGG
ncbi:MAG: hypothetical protein L6E13_06100 [Firmicutes bacterium]|nr:hypothetical protein [Bacillota bacterium]